MASSRTYYTGFQYTPVASMPATVTPWATSRSRSPRSSRMVVLTGPRPTSCPPRQGTRRRPPPSPCGRLARGTAR